MSKCIKITTLESLGIESVEFDGGELNDSNSVVEVVESEWDDSIQYRYKIHWKDGHETYVIGNTLADACKSIPNLKEVKDDIEWWDRMEVVDVQVH